MEILILFPLIALICIILLGYKFIRSKGSIKISILCILFGCAYIYTTYSLAMLLLAFGCGMGNTSNHSCQPTWEKLNADAGIHDFYLIASIGAIYILLGISGIIHKLYLSFRSKK